jgi:hypothetical protein
MVRLAEVVEGLVVFVLLEEPKKSNPKRKQTNRHLKPTRVRILRGRPEARKRTIFLRGHEDEKLP